MRHQLVQWVFLPAGMTDDGFLAVSGYLAPRLRSDEGGTLADFPDFVDWPATVATSQTELLAQRDDGATTAPLAGRGVLGGDSDLWRALFPPETPVRPFVFDDYADRPLVTFPFGRVLDHLRNRWAGLARDAGDDLPFSTANAVPIGPPLDHEEVNGSSLADVFRDVRDSRRTGVFEGAGTDREVSARTDGELREAARRAARLRAEHHSTLQPLIRPFAGGAGARGAFYELAMFHRRPTRDRTPLPTEAAAARAELESGAEFHQLLTSLSYHPTLLRALGLAFDVVLHPEFLPTVTLGSPPSRVRWHVRRPSAFPVRSDPAASPWTLDVTPYTRCRLTSDVGGAAFTAAERTAVREHVQGMVHLDPARYRLAGVDVDGLALKALGMASTLDVQERQPQRPVEEAGRAGVPTLRSSGLVVALTGRADSLHEDFYEARRADDALAGDPTAPRDLTAGQLVRGYRVDVFDGHRQQWFSLHERLGAYTPLRAPDLGFETEDEGFLEVSLTGELDRPEAPADPDGALYAHEAIVTWDGWSLSAPRPGEPVQQEPAPPPASADLGALQLDVSVRATPRSLPRLRFLVDYRVRLRAVDLSGRSLTRARADTTTQLLDHEPGYRVSLPERAFTYRRGEPVPPPELVARAPFSPGEGLERLVIRSGAGLSAAQYAAASQDARDETLRFRGYCDRHVAAAKASLQLVEAHGLFDPAVDAVHAQPDDPAAAVDSYYRVAARENGTFRDVPGARPVAHGDEEQPYVVVDADEVPLPYLPDPLSAGVLVRHQVRSVGGEERLEAEFPPQTDWHDPRPLRLRLVEGGPGVGYDADERLLTVALPAGRTGRLRLSSLFRDDPDVFAVVGWCRETLPPAQADDVARRVAAGEHWMTAPWRTLHLVHAVQQPLEAPSLFLDDTGDGAFHRDRGGTAARLAGTVHLDGASTAHLDLLADWVDVVDDPALGRLGLGDTGRPVGLERPFHTAVMRIGVPEPYATPWGPEVDPLLRATGTDGGQEWYELAFATQDGEQRSPQDVRDDLLERSTDPSLTPQDRSRLTVAASQLDGLRPHELGDTRYRRISYRMVAATRFREYLDPGLPVEATSLTGDTVTVDVLSSAPPVAPVVLDVVPTSRWERSGSATDGRYESRRLGAGLRIWLARPWFSSGAGELLGVVCGRGGPMNPSGELYRQVSVMSQDPARASQPPAPLRTRSLLRTPVAEVHDLRLWPGGPAADLVGYEPRYDPGRDAWYCDIVLDTGEAYLPFVRLGLVRYQPRSVDGCVVSPVVATTLAQPLPDRTVVVVRRTDGLHVSLRGPAGVGAGGANTVGVTVETHDDRVHDPVLGWTPVAGETSLAPGPSAGHSASWAGTVDLPEAVTGLRLVVREYEHHLTDDRSGPAPVLVGGRRLVHADVIPLDAVVSTV
jgi:hypothetical protein